MSAADPTAAFVQRVRARRAAAGKPDRVEDDALYRILDGLLAAKPRDPKRERS